MSRPDLKMADASRASAGVRAFARRTSGNVRMDGEKVALSVAQRRLLGLLLAHGHAERVYRSLQASDYSWEIKGATCTQLVHSLQRKSLVRFSACGNKVYLNARGKMAAERVKAAEERSRGFIVSTAA